MQDSLRKAVLRVMMNDTFTKSLPRRGGTRAKDADDSIPEFQLEGLHSAGRSLAVGSVLLGLWVALPTLAL